MCPCRSSFLAAARISVKVLGTDSLDELVCPISNSLLCVIHLIGSFVLQVGYSRVYYCLGWLNRLSTLNFSLLFSFTAGTLRHYGDSLPTPAKTFPQVSVSPLYASLQSQSQSRTTTRTTTRAVKTFKSEVVVQFSSLPSLSLHPTAAINLTHAELPSYYTVPS